MHPEIPRRTNGRRRRAYAALLVMLLAAACGSADSTATSTQTATSAPPIFVPTTQPGAKDPPVAGQPPVAGVWVLTELHYQGEAIPELAGRLLDTFDDGTYLAAGACNSLGGHFGGPAGGQTQAGCHSQDGIDREAIDTAMAAAFATGQISSSASSLTAETSTLRLVYARVFEPTPAELFSVLTDDSREISWSELPSGLDGGPMEIGRVVELDHPSQGRFFVGDNDGGCASGCSLNSTREAAEGPMATRRVQRYVSLAARTDR